MNSDSILETMKPTIHLPLPPVDVQLLFPLLANIMAYPRTVDGWTAPRNLFCFFSRVIIGHRGISQSAGQTILALPNQRRS